MPRERSNPREARHVYFDAIGAGLGFDCGVRVVHDLHIEVNFKQ
jgi:hypothetical protein